MNGATSNSRMARIKSNLSHPRLPSAPGRPQGFLQAGNSGSLDKQAMHKEQLLPLPLPCCSEPLAGSHLPRAFFTKVCIGQVLTLHRLMLLWIFLGAAAAAGIHLANALGMRFSNDLENSLLLILAHDFPHPQSKIRSYTPPFPVFLVAVSST